MALPSSVEELRAEVVRHFSYIAANAERFRCPPAEAALELEIAPALFDHILTVPTGDMVDIWAWLDASPWAAHRKALARMTPYFCGSGRVLNLEFHHGALGQLPYGVVQQVIEQKDAPVPYQGEQLTTANVLVKFRRENPFV